MTNKEKLCSECISSTCDCRTCRGKDVATCLAVFIGSKCTFNENDTFCRGFVSKNKGFSLKRGNIISISKKP